MITLYFIYSFILGLVLGSFFNVVGLRIPKKQSLVRPRSHCPKCKQPLAFLDLIPVFSFLFLKGKCRSCKTGVSVLYPFVELSTAVLFAVSPIFVGWALELIVCWVFISLLAVIFVSDIVYMVISDRVLLFFGGLLVLLRLWIPLHPWWDAYAGAAVGFGLLLLIAVVSRGNMGGGDIKLFAVIGFVLGVNGTLLSFFFATLYGTLIGGAAMLLGYVKKGEPVPFGPYIVLGALTAYYYGADLLEWYFDLL